MHALMHESHQRLDGFKFALLEMSQKLSTFLSQTVDNCAYHANFCRNTMSACAGSGQGTVDISSQAQSTAQVGHLGTLVHVISQA